ncbi:MBL fold metallo-hydrolase [Gracilibacillus xinjiangensis]|uniref:MBL fold metallo-hydrolase n=1 Tax=Gracilibacillus xinjiangensis TaxID=1193282 RepID=A0ABV8WTK2_9BACI
MIQVEALGGIGEYGRNCFIVTDQLNKTKIMLDCGVRNGNPEVYPNITEEIAVSLQAVFISHVHNDHIGALPLLAAKGFTGEVWMSEGSYHQLSNIIPQWEKKWPVNLIHSLRFCFFDNSTRGKKIPITNHLSIIWGYSGHMLGSVWYSLLLGKQTMFYSGDIALSSPLLVTDTPPALSYDVALLDSGHAAHAMPYEKSITNLLRVLNDPTVRYRIPITISGKACDLFYFLFKAIPEGNFLLDPLLWEHLQAYLIAQDNMCKEKAGELEEILKSDRLSIYDGTKTAGIYLLTSHVGDFKEVNTGDYINEQSPFYKSHPDSSDLKKLLHTIDAKKYIFFHSTESDLEIISAMLLAEKDDSKELKT